MNKEEIFKKTIVDLVELGRKQGNCIGNEQIDEMLETLDFDSKQKDLVIGYLKEQKIGIDKELSPEDFMTKEDMDYLSIYLDALKDLREIRGGEKQAIIISAMAGDENASKKIIEMYLPKVVEIAKLYVGEGAFLEDLIGEGNVALTIGSKMLGCLEHSREAEGFLGKMIMDAMELYLEGIESNASEMKQIIHKLNEILKQCKELTEAYERKITVEELLTNSNYEREEIIDALSLSDELKNYIGELE